MGARARAADHGHSMMTPRDMGNGRSVSIYHEHGVLGADLLLVHCIQANDDEIRWLADSRTPVSISILSNLRCGMGLPPTLAMCAPASDVALARHHGRVATTPTCSTRCA